MDTPVSSARQQGIQAVREGRPDQAVDLLTQAVMADPRDTEALAFLGIAYSQKGHHDEARQAFQTAVARQPQNAHYRFNLGVVLEQAGDQQGAGNAYRETIQLDPQHARARARLQALGETFQAPQSGPAQPHPQAGTRRAADPPSMRAPAVVAGPPPAGPARPGVRRVRRAARPQRKQVLVVGGIIAAVIAAGAFILLTITAAILFPVFAQARERARTSLCMSHLKQMGMGMLLYAQDYDERLPRKELWCDGLMPYVKNPQAFQCPDLPEERGADAYNAQLSMAAVNLVDSPYSTVAAFDARGGWNLSGGADLAVPRHLQGVNVLFTAGNVRWMKSLATVAWDPGAAARRAPGHPLTRHARQRVKRRRRAGALQ